MKEEWKDIKGYEGLYQVSDHGRIYSCRRNILLKSHLTRKGYLIIDFYNKGERACKAVHCLVALHFIGDRPIINGERLSIDHKDEDKLNNHVSNLRYITNRKNSSRSINKKKTTSRYIGVSWDKEQRKWRAQIQINGNTERLGRFHCEHMAGKVYQERLNTLVRTGK